MQKKIIHYFKTFAYVPISKGSKIFKEFLAFDDLIFLEVIL